MLNSSEISQYFLTMPLWEWLAVILSLAYVLLAAKGNKWCWPAAFFSTLIYTLIFYDVALFMDSFLNVYYMVMAVYGWYFWQNKQVDTSSNISSQSTELILQSWSIIAHSKAIALLLLAALAIGFFMANYTSASFPYLDTITTVFALFATYLVAQKIVENWLYWLVIDAISIYLYIAKGLQPTAFLFCIYLIIAAYGYWSWLRKYKMQRSSVNTIALEVEVN